MSKGILGTGFLRVVLQLIEVMINNEINKILFVSLYFCCIFVPMKIIIQITFLLITFIFSQNCLAGNSDNGKSNDNKTSKEEKLVEKQRAQKLKADQKYLKEAKKQFWASQSKQVRKTVKQTQKRDRLAEKGTPCFY